MRAISHLSSALAAAFIVVAASAAFAVDGGDWTVRGKHGRGLAHRERRAAGIAETGRRAEAGRYSPHQPCPAASS